MTSVQTSYLIYLQDYLSKAIIMFLFEDHVIQEIMVNQVSLYRLALRFRFNIKANFPMD